MSNESYRLGQVLFIVFRKETRVYPMQVVEVQVKRSIEREETSFIVRGGQDPKAQVNLKDVDGEVFESSASARTALIERATQSINRLVDMAIEKSKEWYNEVEPEEDVQQHAEAIPLKKQKRSRHQELNDDPSTNIVVLPDGSQVKVKLPEQLQ